LKKRRKIPLTRNKLCDRFTMLNSEKEKMNYYRQKLLNAMLYFAKNMKHCNTTKMSKLLNFLDFLHFKETGQPSIGLKYFAFEQGPVPKYLWLEIKGGNIPADFKDKIAIICNKDDLNPDYVEYEIKPRMKTKPDMSLFSPFEQEILSNLVLMYRDAPAKLMSEVSHLPNQPWYLTYQKGKGKNKYIDYLLSLDDQDEETIDEIRKQLNEHFEMIENYNIKPTKNNNAKTRNGTF
jgi:uncharacterized phage-associated protein